MTTIKNGIIKNGMLWRQFGAAIDMFSDTLRDCPDDLWEKPLWQDQPDQWVASGFASFWYLGYHTLFWLDLYLTGTEEGFTPPPPFALIEMEEDDLPERAYTRQEVLGYLQLCRERCKATIEALTDETAMRRCSFGWGEVSFIELQLYSMRHVQDHAAQVSLLLGQRGIPVRDWVTVAKDPIA
jgi:hypothetical protein